ncbi:MAG: serine/threonine-protein kinase [Polyangiaceae bacterium]
MEGRILAGRYRLISQLGRGGMGSVWRAEHIDLATQAAVKLIDESFAESPEALTRFRREAQAAASLRSVHVVQILDYGIDGGMPYIAMELLDGQSLAERLASLGRLTPGDCASILLQVSKALSRAHELGIVHRDLKPDNIFLVRDGDDEVTKVLDFGIAKRTNGFQTSLDMATRTGSLMGTPYYMSPEQASGRREVDHRTDIWAFAIIAFECILGQRPYDDNNLGGLLLSICTESAKIPSKVGPVPPGFDEWFQRATAKEPEGRFQSIRDAALELCRICGVYVPASRWGSAANLAEPRSRESEGGAGARTPWQDSGARVSSATPAGIVRGETSGALLSAAGKGRRASSSLLVAVSATLGAVALFGGGFFAVQRLAAKRSDSLASASAELKSSSPPPVGVGTSVISTLSAPATAASAANAPSMSSSAPARSAQSASQTPPTASFGPSTPTVMPVKRVRPMAVPAPSSSQSAPAEPPPNTSPPNTSPSNTSPPNTSPSNTSPPVRPEDVPRLKPRDRLERDLGF